MNESEHGLLYVIGVLFWGTVMIIGIFGWAGPATVDEEYNPGETFPY